MALRWRTCASAALLLYLGRAVALALWPVTIHSAFYVSLPHSLRRRHVLAWFASQNVSFPVLHWPGVLVDEEEYARASALGLAPNSRGQAGCRQAHLNVLHNISRRGGGGGTAAAWYLVVEDDVDGSLAHATARLQWLVALVPSAMALNLYSPPIRR